MFIAGGFCSKCFKRDTFPSILLGADIHKIFIESDVALVAVRVGCCRRFGIRVRRVEVVPFPNERRAEIVIYDSNPNEGTDGDIFRCVRKTDRNGRICFADELNGATPVHALRGRGKQLRFVHTEASARLIFDYTVYDSFKGAFRFCALLEKSRAACGCFAVACEVFHIRLPFSRSFTNRRGNPRPRPPNPRRLSFP